MHSEPLPESLVTTCMVDLGHALQHMHGKGWLHLDIKPENVLVSEGRFKLGDFGTCYFVGAGGEEVEAKMVGTGKYMSPELA